MTELESRLDRLKLADGLRPPVLPEADVAYVLHQTPVGELLLAVANGRVVASSFQDEETMTNRLARVISPRVLRQPEALDEVRRQLDEYLAGRRQAFELEVDLTLATPFQRLVLSDLPEHTRYGQTTTYGRVASEIQRPKAVRAVGTALGANPLCIVLPCHRVVGSSGALTGYAGGLEAKRYLIDLESAA